MSFFSQQISPEKWGIYSKSGLLATVSCQATCDTIIANLKNGRRDVPTGELNSLYQVPKLQKRSSPAPATGRRSNRPPVSTRKTRRLKVTSATPRPVGTTASVRASAGTAGDGSTQAHTLKAPDLSGLQKQKIKMAQATGASSQVPQIDEAERA